MQTKVFRIEKLKANQEFKDTKADYKRKRKMRNSRRFKSKVETQKIELLIAKQTKLHNEEKLLLNQQVNESGSPNLIVSVEEEKDFSLQLLKSDSVLNLDQDTKDTNTPVEREETRLEENSKILITSIDAAILESLEFINNAPSIKKFQWGVELEYRLPKRTDTTPEYTLVLDLDETLVHWSISPFEGYDEVRESIYISYRPFLIEFLEKVSQFFEVVVFTASEKEYASMVLDRIDPEQKYIHHRLFRDSWLPLNGNYIKDLNVLGRDIDKTIIIDNSVIAFSLNLDNGIPIHSFSGDKQDSELYKLIEILDYALSIKNCKPDFEASNSHQAESMNLREYLTSVFRLRERINFWQAQYSAHLNQVCQ